MRTVRQWRFLSPHYFWFQILVRLRRLFWNCNLNLLSKLPISFSSSRNLWVLLLTQTVLFQHILTNVSLLVSIRIFLYPTRSSNFPLAWAQDYVSRTKLLFISLPSGWPLSKVNKMLRNALRLVPIPTASQNHSDHIKCYSQLKSWVTIEHHSSQHLTKISKHLHLVATSQPAFLTLLVATYSFSSYRTSTIAKTFRTLHWTWAFWKRLLLK